MVLELISSYSGEEVELRFGFLIKKNRREHKLVNDWKEVQEYISKKLIMRDTDDKLNMRKKNGS